MPRFTYGGQALIEGVLMRGRDAIAVAFRAPSGDIVWAEERIDTGFHGSRWARLPGVRGLVVLYETLVTGTRWLVRSASLAVAWACVLVAALAVAFKRVINISGGAEPGKVNELLFEYPEEKVLAEATVLMENEVEMALGCRNYQAVCRALADLKS